MIQCKLRDIAIETVQQLVAEKVEENESLDYKRELTERDEATANDRLVDLAAAFANSDGGDIVVGVNETAGFPDSMPGVEAESADKLELSIRQRLANIYPRLARVRIRVIPTNDGRWIAVIRIQKSETAVHATDANARPKFPRRDGNRNTPMTAREIEEAFTMRQSVEGRARAWHAARVEELKQRYFCSNHYRIPVAIHAVPASSRQETERAISIEPHLRAFGDWHLGARVEPNIHGLLIRKETDVALQYRLQVFRNGAIELCTPRYGVCKPVSVREVQAIENLRIIRVGYFQVQLPDIIRQIARAQIEWQVTEPVYLFCTMWSTAGASVHVAPERGGSRDVRPIEFDHLDLGDARIDDLNDAAALDEFAQSVIRRLYNAGGYEDTIPVP